METLTVTTVATAATVATVFQLLQQLPWRHGTHVNAYNIKRFLKSSKMETNVSKID